VPLEPRHRLPRIPVPVRGGAENTDAPASVVDGSEDVLALSGEGDGLDEVHRQDRLGLGAQEASPRDGRPLRGWVNAIGLEDLPHGGGSDLDAGEDEFAVDAPVAPGGVLGCQAEDEAADRGESARTPRSASRRIASAASSERPTAIVDGSARIGCRCESKEGFLQAAFGYREVGDGVSQVV
jgi:hypothetical protein